jgi:hypothetical protein
MKKTILILGLLVNTISGFTQNTDTTKKEIYTFHEAVNEASDHGIEYYEFFVEAVAEYSWGVSAYNSGIQWVGIDNHNLTFDYIIYTYFEFDSNGKKHINTLQMGPKEADEYFKARKN